MHFAGTNGRRHPARYDTLGQVTLGRKFWADGTAVLGQQFDYTFDDIGNRKTAVTGGDQWGVNKRYQNYSANLLNQYTQRTVPGYAEVVGTANSNATVTVQSSTGVSPASRKGEYFRSEVRAENWTGPVWLGVTNVAVLPDGQNSDIVTNTTGHLVVPQTPETFAHDADGNLTRDGVWTNFWDAENRLVAQETLAAVYGAGAPRQRLEYDYDPQGRRLLKRAYQWVSGNWSLKYAVRFVWDGWNLLAEVNPTNHLGIRSYGWGLDVSGSAQGAGGVGGLLWVSEHGTAQPSVHFAAFDGNGNVAALVDAVAGTVSANYEYGPFGEAIRQTGPLSKANPFRFSTKYQEEETGCLYYGYRSYNPSIGRWLSRDPTAQRLVTPEFAFNRNDGFNKVDYLGMWSWCKCEGVSYNPFTECCCTGKIYSRKKQKTKIKLCSAPVEMLGVLGHILPYHHWLEVEGGSSVEFMPSSGIPLGSGVAVVPATSAGKDKSCTVVELVPCRYDIRGFEASITDRIAAWAAVANPETHDTPVPPIYVPGVSDCENFVNDLVETAKNAARVVRKLECKRK